MGELQVNSKEYWDSRFKGDWEESNGREQTIFFYNLAIEYFPTWLKEDIMDNELSIYDAGCATGDGTRVLVENFKKSTVIGADFSQSAIDKANIYYPDIKFICEDMSAISQEYDIIFSSNTLEHFSQPNIILNEMSKKTKKYIILILPFQDNFKIEEHYYTFDNLNILYKIDSFKLAFHEEIDCKDIINNYFWEGKQVLLIYTNESNPILEYSSGYSFADYFRNEYIKEKQEYNIITQELNKIIQKHDLITQELSIQKQKHNIIIQDLNTYKEDYNTIIQELNKHKEEYNTVMKLIDKQKEEYNIVKLKLKNQALEIEKNNKIIQEQKDRLLKKEEIINSSKGVYSNFNRQLIYIANMKPYRLAYFIKRLQMEFFQGNNKSKRMFLHWIAKKILKRPCLPNYKYNPLFQLSQSINNKLNLKPEDIINEEDIKISSTEDEERLSDLKQLNQILEKHKDRKIIIFPVLVDWNIPLFQRPQHIAKNLAKQGFLFFFCTQNMKFDNINGFHEIIEGCYLTNKTDIVYNINRKKLLYICSTDNKSIDLFVNQSLGKGDIILYDFIDEIHDDITGKVPNSVIIRHKRILKDERCIVVATAEKLYKEVLQYRGNNNCALITNGVEVEHFNAKYKGEDIPKEIKHIIKKDKPIIGYFGAFAKWFDYDLIKEIAKERPNYEILLIGWDYDGSLKSHKLDKFSNVTVIGPINYKRLPQYAYWFDISIIPFLLNDITESTSPIKLFEYMALGHPIVTTDMPECRKYESVLIGNNHEDFIRKIDNALLLGSDEVYKEVITKEALENTWEAKAKEITQLINKVFDKGE